MSIRRMMRSIPASSQDPTLIDLYPENMSHAFSLRRLSSTFNDCMVVERASDNAELTVGFDSEGWIDEAAIAAFCGTSDGWCTRWINQLGTGVDHTINSIGFMPRIYNGATQSLIRDGGFPAIEFNNNAFLSSSNYALNAANFALFSVSRPDGSKNVQPIWTVWNSGTDAAYEIIYDSTSIFFRQVRPSVVNASRPVAQRKMQVYGGKAGNFMTVILDDEGFETTPGITIPPGNLVVGYGGLDRFAANRFSGYIHEFVAYSTTDKEDDRNAISVNQQEAWGI